MAHLTKIFAVSALLLAEFGCSSAPDPKAFDNRVFYERGAGGDQEALAAFETPYPPLDLDASPPKPGYMGVSVLEGTVRLSRPKNWIVRRASNEPEKRFIEYMSPNQVMFAVYERIEAPYEPWRVVLSRYSEELEAQGGKLLSKVASTSTWNAQARVFDVQRSVAAPKEPFANFSREYLVRSEKRIVLLQLVRQTESLEPVSDEALRVLSTLQVL